MTIILDISYYGKEFSGYAKQPGQLTVQGDIEKALEVIFQHAIETTCAGRTDAGVHAKHQFVSFSADLEMINKLEEVQNKLCRSIEQLTHDDIHINNVCIVDYDFSARHDAKSRKYSYFITNQNSPSIIFRDCSWHILKKLELKSMKRACSYLIGEHDFKSFCVAASAKDKSTCRNISSIEIVEHEIFDDHIIEIKVEGNAFLHSMVRTLVGTLIKIGLGYREPEWMLEVLNAKNRQAAGECAPAKGLVLMDVQY